MALTALNGEDSANWQPSHCLLSASTSERLLCPKPRDGLASAGAVPPYPVLISRVGCRSWARSSWVLASCCMRRKWRAAPISSTVIMAGCVSSREVTCGTSTSQSCHGQCMSRMEKGHPRLARSRSCLAPNDRACSKIGSPQHTATIQANTLGERLEKAFTNQAGVKDDKPAKTLDVLNSALQ